MSRIGSTILYLLAVVAVALLLTVVCRICFVEMYTVAPQQMENALLAGDRVLVEKWHYGVRLPQSYVSLPYVDTLPVPTCLPDGLNNHCPTSGWVWRWCSVTM